MRLDPVLAESRMSGSSTVVPPSPPPPPHTHTHTPSPMLRSRPRWASCRVSYRLVFLLRLVTE